MTASQVAIVLSVPDLVKADAGTFLHTAEAAVEAARHDLDRKVRLVSIVKSDKNLVPVEFTDVAATQNHTSTRSANVTTSRVGIAGAGAGNHTVTGIKTTDTLVAVLHSDDTSHAVTDKTSEYTISAADTINNTSGTDSTGSHVIVVSQRT